MAFSGVFLPLPVLHKKSLVKEIVEKTYVVEYGLMRTLVHIFVHTTHKAQPFPSHKKQRADSRSSRPKMVSYPIFKVERAVTAHLNPAAGAEASTLRKPANPAPRG